MARIGNLHRQKIDQWLPRAGGGKNGNRLPNEDAVCFAGDLNILKLDCCDHCTTLRIY